jgi:DNA replication licensing factor MCM7
VQNVSENVQIDDKNFGYVYPVCYIYTFFSVCIYIYICFDLVDSERGREREIDLTTIQRERRDRFYVSFPKNDLDARYEHTRTHAQTGSGRSSLLGPKYLHLIKQISKRRLNLLVISLDDVYDYGDDGEGEMLARNIERNAKRYVKLMCEAVDDILKQDYSRSSSNDDAENTDEEALGLDPDDPVDIFMANRIDRTNEMSQSRGLDNDGGDNSNNNTGMPPELLRRYEVVFQPRSEVEHLSIRQIGARHIGRLVKIRGMITKVTDVKPLVSIVTYTCDMCGNEIYQEVKKRNFVPLRECPSQTCEQNNQSGRLFMMSRGCKFVKYQTAKMQELPNQVRSIEIHLSFSHSLTHLLTHNNNK